MRLSLGLVHPSNWQGDFKLATSFQESLKSEIGRVARQQLKKELESLRLASKKQRSEITALKRDVASLTTELRKLKKLSITNESKAASDEVDAAVVVRPVSADELIRKREELGLTQLEVSQLVGVSSQSIHKWESGNVHPRARQLPQIHAFLKLGKRAAKQRLLEMSEDPS